MQRWREPMGVQDVSARTTVSWVHGQAGQHKSTPQCSLVGHCDFPFILSAFLGREHVRQIDYA
jgi:hypothetical protein